MTLDMFSEKEKKSTDDSLFYTNYTFSQGSFILAGTADGLSAIGFPKTNPDIFFKNLKVRYPGHQLVKSEGPFLEAINQLEEYFNAQRQDFDLKLDLVGTAFQLRVWQYLFKIDFGTTQTYGQVARALEGNPRTVGRAIGDNPIPLVVPCHRVIGKKGQMVGYAGGINFKIWLLEHEGAILL